MPELIVKHVNGVASSFEVRGHKYVIDVPETMGGENQGPTPVEIFAASLGSCILFYVARWCRESNINCQGTEVVVEFEHDRQKHCVTSLNARLKLPSGFPEVRQNAALRVAQQCTIHNTLCNAPSMEISLA